ncbi:hypothetical protein ABPG74_005251 [Tetrahymena malaccensis]
MEEENLDTKLKNIIQILKQEQRTQHQVKKLEDMTLDVPFFQQYRQEGKEFIHKRCCALMEYEYFQSGEVVFHIDTTGEKFYIVLKGTVGVYIKIDGQDEVQQEIKRKEKKMQDLGDENSKQDKKIELTCVKELKDGTSFGELSLLQNKKRLATIICHTNCHMAILNKQQFVQVLGESEEQKILKEMQFFADYPFFQGWNFNLLKLLYLNSYIKQYTKGQVVFQENQDSNAVFFIKSGEFEVEKYFQYTNIMQSDEYKLEGVEKQSFQQNDQKIGIKSLKKKKKESNLLHENSSNIEKDSLGKLVKLCIYSDREMFGEEDIIKGQRRSFTVKCISFTGELIMVKLKDFYNRVLCDYRTKQSILQRLEKKDEMMNMKISLLEKSMHDFSDFYFPQSRVIASMKAQNIPLFRKCQQTFKNQNHDRTYNFAENFVTQSNFLNSKQQKSKNLSPQPSRIEEKSDDSKQINSFTVIRSSQFITIPNSPELKFKKSLQKQQLMPSLSLQHSQSDSSEQNQQNISIQLPTHNFSKYKQISSSRNIQHQNSNQIKRKYSCQQQLIKSKTFIAPKLPKEEDSPQLPETCQSKTIILSQKQINTSNCEAMKQPSITCLTQINNENKINDSVNLQNSRSSYSQNSPQSPFLISNFKAIDNLANDSIQESQSNKNDHFSMLLSTNSQNNNNNNNNNNGLLDIPFSTSNRNIKKVDELVQNQNEVSQLFLIIPNEIKTNEVVSENKKTKKYFDQQIETNSCNSKSVFLKTQNSSNGQSAFQFTNEHETTKPQNQKKSTQDKQNDINQMTDSFYKTLRINYFNKFKSQNIQNLKKHIQSSLINKMPDSFTPLDRGDLSLYQKKEKGDFEQQKDQFIKWFNQEMYKDRQYQRIQSQALRKQKELNKIQSEKPQDNSDQIIFSKTQEGFNNSRIHSKEINNMSSLRQKKKNFLNIQVQTQFTDENFKSNLDTSETRKSSLHKIKHDDSQIQIKPYKSTIVSRESSQEITSPSSAFKKLSIKKEQESNPFKANSIQSVYQKHLIKQDFKVKNKNSTDGFQTERTTQVFKNNSFKNNFTKTDYDFFLNKESQTNTENKQIFKSRLEVLKKLKKPQSQNSLRTLIQQNNSNLQIDTSLHQKTQKESSKMQESYSQKLSNMLTYSKSPVSLKSFQNLSTKNQQIKLVNQNYYNQNTSNTNNSILSQEYNSFNFFKKSCERKVLSKFEQELFDPYKISKNKNFA